MFAMTGRLAAETHRRQRSITRAVVPESIRKAILPAMWASMQADAFDGYNQLYKAQRKPAPILKRPAGATAGGSLSTW